MNYRLFGNTPLKVSEVGFGCSQIGGTVETKSDGQVVDTLLEALDEGINFYDTADLYAQGQSERLLGRAFRHKRDSVIIATKAGYRLTSAGALGARLKPIVRPLVRALPWMKKSVRRARSAQIGQDFSPGYLRRAIDSSLARLQTDYVDIFQLHSPDSSTIEMGEFLETLETVKAQGKIRHYGVACRSVEDAFLCLRYPGICSVQIPINLFEFERASSFLTLAQELNIAVIARQALASGFLARPASLLRPEDFHVGEEEFRQKLAQAEAFQFLDSRNGRTLAQAALQFVLQLAGVSVVIVGMRSRAHLHENLVACVHRLPANEVAQISAVQGTLRLAIQENKTR